MPKVGANMEFYKKNNHKYMYFLSELIIKNVQYWCLKFKNTQGKMALALFCQNVEKVSRVLVYNKEKKKIILR